jgi:hypothetical protein
MKSHTIFTMVNFSNIIIKVRSYRTQSGLFWCSKFQHFAYIWIPAPPHDVLGTGSLHHQAVPRRWICRSGEMQHLGCYKSVAARGRSNCRGSSILAPRNLMVAAILPIWSCFVLGIIKVAIGEDFCHSGSSNSCVMSLVDQIVKWVKPTPSKASLWWHGNPHNRCSTDHGGYKDSRDRRWTSHVHYECCLWLRMLNGENLSAPLHGTVW